MPHARNRGEEKLMEAGKKVTAGPCEEANRSNSNRWMHDAWTGGEQVINIRQRNVERKGRSGRGGRRAPTREEVKEGGDKRGPESGRSEIEEGPAMI